MTDYRKLTVDTYNRSAKELAEYFRGVGSRVDDIDKAFELAGNPPAPTVLEIGCGDGRDAKEICARTPHYVGFDISEELIKIAREHVPGAKFEVADAMNYTYPTDTLDVVFAFASLLHLDRNEIKTVIHKVHQSLIDGGVFYISLKFSEGYKQQLKEDKFGTRMFYFYNPQLLIELAGEGWSVVYEDKGFITAGNTEWFELALKKQPEL